MLVELVKRSGPANQFCGRVNVSPGIQGDLAEQRASIGSADSLHGQADRSAILFVERVLKNALQLVLDECTGPDRSDVARALNACAHGAKWPSEACAASVAGPSGSAWCTEL